MVLDLGHNYEVIKMHFFTKSFEKIQELWEGILSLDFAIPEQIFLVLNILTHYVGYIMPLRLYTPIITLILGYWFLMILSHSIAFVSGLLRKFIRFSK